MCSHGAPSDRDEEVRQGKARVEAVQVYLPENAAVTIRRLKGRVSVTYDDPTMAMPPTEFEGPVASFPLIIPVALCGPGLIGAPSDRDSLGKPILGEEDPSDA